VALKITLEPRMYPVCPSDASHHTQHSRIRLQSTNLIETHVPYSKAIILDQLVLCGLCALQHHTHILPAGQILGSPPDPGPAGNISSNHNNNSCQIQQQSM
jgi:hypothetical protein